MFRMKGFVFVKQVNWQTKPSNSFSARLKQKAQTCEFGDATTVDEQIRGQVISKCLSHELRRKLLQ